LLKGTISRATPEEDRQIKDKQIAWVDQLVKGNHLTQVFNWGLFTYGASSQPETAGLGVALIGSLYMMLIVILLAVPIGVAAAIYLEEFAPKNRVTDLIEVNINNLAAVPSIVFGLLGLAIFINLFGLPRSASLVGGMVLTLMTLPTVIIAARAAITAVPPSIRQAALGIGASKMQSIFHHVLPLAMPGILTGTIIGLAKALGETAPLLMIGMVAFVVDYPKTPLDPATALPVQIYMWSTAQERGFIERTSGAAIVLLLFLLCMNLIAVILRRRFERKW
jgi:phosphate transport system permease protein